jgi:hypothetical protein
MKKKIYILILLVALLSTQIYASNITIHSSVEKEDSQYTAYLSYLPDHIFTQYTQFYDSEYEQYRSQFQNLSSSSSFQIDPDELRNNDSDKLMNGAFILTVNGLSEDHVLVDQFFDVVIETGEFYKVESNGDKTSTGIEVKVYDVQYKPITKESDGGYRISTRTYTSTYDNRGVKHFYLGWTGNPNLGPGRYETDFTFRIIDQT